MRRRDLLGTLAGLPAAGLAGCLGSDSGGGGETTTGTPPGGDTTTEPTTTLSTTEPPTATPTATPAGSVSVAVDALQPGVVALNTADSIGVTGTGFQYLFLAVEAESPAPEPSEFAFRLEDDHDPTGSDDLPRRWWLIRRTDETLYDADRRAGLVVFELPNAASDADPALTWPGGEWRPDGRLRERLVTFDPPMSVELDGSETLEPGEEPTLSVTATNEGDVPGRFLAGLNRVGPSVAYTPVQRVSFPVGAGATETVTVTDDSIDVGGGVRDEDVGDAEDDATYHLDWTGDRVSLSLRYVDG